MKMWIINVIVNYVVIIMESLFEIVVTDLTFMFHSYLKMFIDTMMEVIQFHFSQYYSDFNFKQMELNSAVIYH